MERTAHKPQEKIIHSFDDSSGSSNRKVLFLFVGIILLGVVTGLIGARLQSGTKAVSTSGNEVTGEEIVEAAKKGEIIGSTDESTFSDTAEGKLVPGGIEGEGEYHLERPGGESQNVYLTSSVIDLSKFVDRKVKVWGKTFQGQRAGWLMDVGRLQVLD